jgi:TonB family protein
MARVDQGVAAPAAARRLGIALAVSLAAHAALLAAVPQPWHPAASSSASAAALEVRFFAEQIPAGTAAAPGSPRAPRYYTVEQLDQRPQIMTHVEPQFPALALAPVGRVVLRLYVDEAGRVDRVAVESDDPNGAFAQSAREAFAAARFVPGMRRGVAVKALVRLEVLFGSPHPDNNTL